MIFYTSDIKNPKKSVLPGTMGKAIKIIDIDAKGESFLLDEEALKSILSKVPSDLKLNIVSVVGAFRTGKSFILDLFLRYLNHSGKSVDKCEGEPDESWLFEGGFLEGNNNNTNDDEKGDSTQGFGWRSGRERCTTGIWMWSDYFIRPLPETGETVAILIMDTQGMFDSTLGQHLTASIFGLSTLISSYSVYNLDKRVQEDNLQHLALFSEYGRVALVVERKRKDDQEWYSTADGEGQSTGDGPRPFQRLELLVRDWQDFSDEHGTLESLHDDMRTYLDEVLAERHQKDLREVRDQIRLCFETVSCWLLPHPGFEVIKKTYNGDLQKVSTEFRRLVCDYIRRVFSLRMTVKKIHGRPVRAMELFNFVKAYCSLFKEAKIFPEAKTLLAATAQANNLTAVQSAMENYKREMDILAGTGKPYVSDSKLRKHHEICENGALAKYEEIATIGPQGEIKLHRDNLVSQIRKKYIDYSEANKLRDPFGFVAPFIIPIAIAVFAYVCRYILETVCPRRSMFCLDISDFFAALFYTILGFLFFHFAAQGHGIQQRVKLLFGGQPQDD